MSHVSGERCPQGCGGYLRVYCTKPPQDDRQIQYLHCPKCGRRPDGNKVIKPADRIRRRTASTKV